MKVWNETARIVDPDDRRGRIVQNVVAANNASHYIVPPRRFQPSVTGQYSWSDWAQLIPADDELVIRTRSNRLRVPEVIVLTSYDRLPSNAVTFSRRNIFKRDRFTCQYCGKQPGSEELTIDHVLPRAQGGTSTWENCVLACVECNAKKADRTPDQARMPLRREPVRPVWKPLYGSHGMRIDSWSKFVSEAYWTTRLEE